ncbi:MAG: YceI family protein [Pseudomonadota bacterium]
MKTIRFTLLALSIVTTNVMADDYVIDKTGMHASIQFKISHLGYSWLWGRFNNFGGTFNYDKNKPEASKIEVTINTNSLDSNHAERDKHLRSDDFLDVSKYPKAKFTSTSFTQKADGSGILKGDFSLHGVTKPIIINVQTIGEGKDPWGGYRIGFSGTSRIALADYDIAMNLGPASQELDLIFSIEGVRK